jgi:hypothetical protein
MITLEQNDTFTLALDNIKHGEWCLELIDRASGNVKILVAPNKDKFDGVTLTHAIRWTDKMQWVPMYKKGIM